MPPTTVLVFAPQIRVNGTELDRAAVRRHHRPPRLAVGLRAEPADAALARPRLRARRRQRLRRRRPDRGLLPRAQRGMLTVFSGEIVSIGSDQRADRPDACRAGRHRFDKGHRLGKTTACGRSRTRPTPTSWRQIAREQGLRPSVDPLDIKFPYLIQTTTNFALLNEIAFRTGCEWSVNGDGTAVPQADDVGTGRGRVRRGPAPAEGAVHVVGRVPGRVGAVVGSVVEADGRRHRHVRPDSPRRRQPRFDRSGDHRAQQGQAVRRHARCVVADRPEPGGGHRARRGAGHTPGLGRPVRPRRLPRHARTSRPAGRSRSSRPERGSAGPTTSPPSSTRSAATRHGDDVHDRRRRPSSIVDLLGGGTEQVEGFGRSG